MSTYTRNLSGVSQLVENTLNLATLYAPLVHNLGDVLHGAYYVRPRNIGKVKEFPGNVRKRVPGQPHTGVDFPDGSGCIVEAAGF